MYTSYWNLNERPFQNSPDLRFAYFSTQHKEALARLLYLIAGRKLGGVLIGPYGVGKSMVLSMLADKVKEMGSSYVVQLDTPIGGAFSLARQILSRLGHKERIEDLGDAITIIETVCSEKQSAFPHLTLVIDECQMIRDQETVEFLHLLTNMRILRKDGSYGQNAITLILSGHGDILNIVIKDPSFCQRLQMVYKLTELTLAQLVEYVHSRIRAAGGDIWCFDQSVFPLLHENSQGLPRIVNNICDVALILGHSAGMRVIDQTIMQQAIEEVNSPAINLFPVQEVSS